MALCGTSEPGRLVNNPPARNPEQLLAEDEVVAAVRGHLEGAGWVIKTWALAIEHGDDIVAEREGRRLIVEAKGEGSSKTGSHRFGNPFSRSQVGSHVPRAIYKALRALAENAEAGVAFPDTPLHRAFVGAVQPVTSHLGISVFWVDRPGSVSVE
jgi:hypothetical protein